MNSKSLERMSSMKLLGMHRAFENLIESKQHNSLTNDEIINLLLQSEWEFKQNKRLETSLKLAKFRYQASIEQIHFSTKRNLDKNMFLRLADCGFIDKRENVLCTGATGVGKSYLVSALGHQACQKGYKVMYFNSQKLFLKLKLAKADGTYLKELAKMEKQDVLIIDDFGLQPLDASRRMDLLEIIEDRHGRKSTIISSQLPVAKWHEVIEESTVADAILDRLIHGAHRLELKGESLRKI